METKINKQDILPPEVTLSEKALCQLKLILENDFTLAGKYFRILISGKGCDGFTYSIGFSDIENDDYLVRATNAKTNIEVIVDPFTAFYLQNATIDYFQDLEANNEGFTVTNHQQKKFSGKFWNKDQSSVPQLEKQ